jgi:hypothetical protein
MNNRTNIEYKENLPRRPHAAEMAVVLKGELINWYRAVYMCHSLGKHAKTASSLCEITAGNAR